MSIIIGMANNTKRKQKLISSIDSVHITVKGDAGTSHDPHGIFSYFTPQHSELPNHFKSVKNIPFYLRNNPRDTKWIKLQNDLTITCSSSGQKGVQIQNDNEETSFASGGLVYQVGGISSYNHNYTSDTHRLLDFFEVLRQNWDFNMELSRIDFSFDLLQDKESLSWQITEPNTKSWSYLNTDYIDYNSSKIQAKIYNKNLKDKTYLDVTRVELVCKNDFFKKIKNFKLLMTENDKELRENAKTLAEKLVTFFEKKLVLQLPHSNVLLPNVDELMKQIIHLVKVIKGQRSTSNNKFNPLQNLCGEQINLINASNKMDEYIKNLEKITSNKIDRLILEEKLPATRTGIHLEDGTTISLSTIRKIRKFFEKYRTKLIADNLEKTIKKIKSRYTGDFLKLHQSVALGELSGDRKNALACIKKKYLYAEISEVYNNIFNPALSSNEKDISKALAFYMNVPLSHMFLSLDNHIKGEISHAYDKSLKLFVRQQSMNRKRKSSRRVSPSEII